MEDQRRAFFSGLAAWGGLIFTALVSTGSATYTFAILAGRVNQAEKAIDEMKGSNRDSANTLTEIDRRTARMEAKLEILLPSSSLKEMEARR